MCITSINVSDFCDKEIAVFKDLYLHCAMEKGEDYDMKRLSIERMLQYRRQLRIQLKDYRYVT